MVPISNVDGRVWVQRKPHDAMDSLCHVGNLKIGGFFLTLPVTFIVISLSYIITLETSFAGKGNVHTLGNVLHAFINLLFQHNNEILYHSRLEKRWLELYISKL